MKICKFKEKFIGYGAHDGACPYDFPDCLKKVKVCYFHDKLQDLRIDTEHWDEDISRLKDELDFWEVTPKGNVLVKIKDGTYEERMEEHYLFSDKWGKEKEKRPWRHSIELESYTEDGLEL